MARLVAILKNGGYVNRFKKAPIQKSFV